MLASPGIDWLIEVFVVPSTQHIKQKDVAFGGLKNREGLSLNKCAAYTQLLLSHCNGRKGRESVAKTLFFLGERIA